MDKVSKNIYKGERIIDVREIERLANEQKPIVQEVGHGDVYYIVRPAAFYIGWPLRLILNTKFYYSVLHYENIK
jgi:hypothetical protein